MTNTSKNWYFKLTLAMVDLSGLSFCLASIWRLKMSPLVVGRASLSISFVTYNFPVVGSMEKYHWLLPVKRKLRTSWNENKISQSKTIL